jgi:hypothetical protein
MSYGRAGAPGGAGGFAPGFGNDAQLVVSMPNTAPSSIKPNILFFIAVMFSV